MATALPPDLTERYTVEANVTIDASGELADLQIVISSGNAAVDALVVHSWRSSTLPPPPERLLTEGWVYHFNGWRLVLLEQS
ncbi:MAG: TonB C-terminal domain-containing protein [Proteobacteria bacterium]|nr:TonB C-terminal domain-containing protein [Pseudomonadota bacterium]